MPVASRALPFTVAPPRHLARVLVGWDGSPEATAAAAFALRLRERNGTRVTLAHVSSAPAGAARPHDVPVDVHILHGQSAAGALIEAADEMDADLIALGTHGVGWVGGTLLGSVSSQVLFHASRSILLFRDGREAGQLPATVLVAVDGSEPARHALVLGQAAAVSLGAHLVLVHVADAHVPFAGEPMKGMTDVVRRHGAAVLHEARQVVAAPLDVVREDLVVGHVREELVAACDRYAPALLVIGSRGLGGFKGLLVGSTSRWAANCAPCPVLVARSPSAAG